MVERVNDYHEGNRHFQDRFDTRRLEAYPIVKTKKSENEDRLL